MSSVGIVPGLQRDITQEFTAITLPALLGLIYPGSKHLSKLDSWLVPHYTPGSSGAVIAIKTVHYWNHAWNTVIETRENLLENTLLKSIDYIVNKLNIKGRTE